MLLLSLWLYILHSFPREEPFLTWYNPLNPPHLEVKCSASLAGLVSSVGSKPYPSLYASRIYAAKRNLIP